MASVKENIIELKDVIIDKLENMSIVNNMVNVFLLSSKIDKKILNEHTLTFKKTLNGNIIISSDVGCEKTIFNNIKIYDCVSLRINSEFINMLSEFSRELKIGYVDRFYKFISKFSCKKCILRLIFKYSSNKDWVLIGDNNDIYDLISKCKSFEHSFIESDSNIKNIGSVIINGRKIIVYQSSNISNRIYFGKYDDVSIMISKDIKLEQIKNKHIFKLTLYYKYIRSNKLIPYITF